MEHLSRPASQNSSGEQIRAWVEWFGLGRLVVSAFAVAVVCVGAFWLVRTPPPPTEASIPRAVASTAPPLSQMQVTSDPEQTNSGRVTVHVAGAVKQPGVYELEQNARVQSAIETAGGAEEDADLDALNLAALVVDGSRVYVPIVGEVVPNVASQLTTEEVQTIVDINRASALDLDRLPGIGPATAAAIITERDSGGPFIDVDSLLRVPGIGPAKLELLRELVTT